VSHSHKTANIFFSFGSVAYRLIAYVYCLKLFVSGEFVPFTITCYRYFYSLHYISRLLHYVSSNVCVIMLLHRMFNATHHVILPYLLLLNIIIIVSIYHDCHDNHLSASFWVQFIQYLIPLSISPSSKRTHMSHTSNIFISFLILFSTDIQSNLGPLSRVSSLNKCTLNVRSFTNLLLWLGCYIQHWCRALCSHGHLVFSEHYLCSNIMLFLH